MTGMDYREMIEGFDQVKREIETLRKYGFGYEADRGRAARVVDGLHPKTLDVRVSEIREETASAKTLRLVSAGRRLPPFLAGQYINLFVEVGGIRTSRPYSISSPPNQTGYYDLTVRAVPDGFVSSHLLEEVRVGQEFSSSGPAGYFYHNPLLHGQNLVFLAGGSGVTPFMSRIREAAERGLDRNIQLIYGCRTPDDVIFGPELDDIASRHPNIKVDLVVSEPPAGYEGRTGFITAELIREIVGPPENKTFYLCGPEAMYAFCLPELAKFKLPRRRLRTEVFGPPADVTRSPGWPEGVKRDDVFQVGLSGGRSVAARAGEPLLNSLERAGLNLPAQCRSGECSYCRTKLLSGTVFHPAGAKLRKSDRTFGFIHPCLAYPVSDLELLL